MIAYVNGVLDPRTLETLYDGLLSADKSERGQTLLTLFRMSHFEAPAKDFTDVLGQALKVFPPTGTP